MVVVVGAAVVGGEPCGGDVTPGRPAIAHAMAAGRDQQEEDERQETAASAATTLRREPCPIRSPFRTRGQRPWEARVRSGPVMRGNGTGLMATMGGAARLTAYLISDVLAASFVRRGLRSGFQDCLQFRYPRVARTVTVDVELTVEGRRPLSSPGGPLVERLKGIMELVRCSVHDGCGCALDGGKLNGRQSIAIDCHFGWDRERQSSVEADLLRLRCPRTKRAIDHRRRYRAA